MSEQRKRGGWSNPASAANGSTGGRPPAQAVVREGDGLMLTRVYADSVIDLGHGKARIEKHGHSRLIVLAQSDGSEIRILIPK